MVSTLEWPAYFCKSLVSTALVATVLMIGTPGMVSAAPQSVTVTAAVFPAESCQEGSAQNTPGATITCKGVNDLWLTATKAYTISFGGYVNSTGKATGDLQFKEWSPYAHKPIYQHDFGQQHLTTNGEWFRVSASGVRNKPGDYWAGLYFNGKVIGWTPVNCVSPAK